MKKRSEKKFMLTGSLTGIPFTEIAETCPAGIFITDPAGNCHYVNNFWCKITGLTKTEVKKTFWLDLIHPDDKDNLSGAWERFKMDKSPMINEFRIIDKKGITKWLAGVIKVLESLKNSESPIIGIFLEVSEIKKTGAESEKYRMAYKNLIENSFDAILLTSPDGRIFSANPAACRMFGRSEEELCRLGRDCVVDHSDPRLAKALRIRDIKGNFFGELRMIRKSGKKFQAEISSSIFTGETGEKYTSMIIREISQKRLKSGTGNVTRKSFESRYFKEYQDAIENERSQIALELHDDLGQRFSSLKLYLAWLKNRIGVQSQSVKTKLIEMNSLIDESMSRIRDFISILKPSVLFELGLVESLKWQLDRFENQTKIRCNFFSYPEEFNLDEDKSLALFRILQEALTNIRKHADAGSVAVELRLLRKTVIMRISDNGKGFSLEKVNLISSRGISGMKERVKFLGGKFFIKSVIEKGTIIKVSLPTKPY